MGSLCTAIPIKLAVSKAGPANESGMAIILNSHHI